MLFVEAQAKRACRKVRSGEAGRELCSSGPPSRRGPAAGATIRRAARSRRARGSLGLLGGFADALTVRALRLADALTVRAFLVLLEELRVKIDRHDLYAIN